MVCQIYSISLNHNTVIIFVDNVRTICLPFSDLKTEHYNKTITVIGFGYTESTSKLSNDLMYATLSLAADCQSIYTDEITIEDDNQFCAGNKG